MGRGQKELKNLAKQAKKRLSGGFWEDYKERVQDEVQVALKEGESTSNVIEYYKNLAVREILQNDEQKENFYKRVKKILDEEGEVSNMIARLCDDEYFKSLNFSEKQRYLFEIADSYCKCKARYDAEKRFEEHLGGIAR